MPPSLEITAHRGASHDAPENTLAAVELAWRQGADAVEADFRLTRDGHVVASHDDSTERIAGVDLRVHESSLAELRELDFGGWKGAEFAGLRIPTLDEVLATLPPGKRLYVEIKCGSEIAEPLAVAVRAADVGHEQIVPICFSAAVLIATRRLLPESPTYLVAEFLCDRRTDIWYPDAEAIVAEAARAEFSGVALMAARVDEPLAETVRQAGLDLSVWTVDSVEEARRLMDLGVRRITTNRPGWLRGRIEG
ncbi:MAG TPA: glycerophosphodiester phosphodiesterase [Pirellulales bacterium]|nr:glycerophosphodiester phosphodiesterase [Pirellulales bacterium]